MGLDHLRNRKLTDKQIAQFIRILAAEPRFDAVVQLLDRNLEQWIVAASDQKLADSPGKTTHALGSVHAVRMLLAQIDNAVNKPGRESGPKMEPPE